MTKVKIGIKESQLGECDGIITEYSRRWSDVKNEYDKLGLRKLTTEDLKQIFNKNFLTDILLENSDLKIGNIKVSRDKAKQLIDIPYDDSKFNAAVKDLWESSRQNASAFVFVNDFVVKGEKVIFPDADNTITARLSIFTSDPQQINMFETLNKICDAINDCQHPHLFAYLFHGSQTLIVRKGLKFVVNGEAILSVR